MFFSFPIICAVTSLIVAQVIKLPINYFINKEWDFGIVLSTGGMPSSHSAFVTSLAISIGIIEGINSSLFAISFVLAGVVIHDAMGIRREAGRHATVLNKMGKDIEDLFKLITKHEYNKGAYNQKFKELLGHEPSEAFSGILLGFFITVIIYYFQYTL